MRSPDHPPAPTKMWPELQAMEWIKSERQRQIQGEGWSAVHDDQHSDGELLRAAGAYIWHGTNHPMTYQEGGLPMNWPWDAKWWKPKSRQRNLIRAGALCLAERDRCRRAGLPTDAADHKYRLVIRELVALGHQPIPA